MTRRDGARGREGLRQAVGALVRAIPAGRATSYGEIAYWTGTAPRAVGTILQHIGEPDLPWHRVVNAAGLLSNPHIRAEQAKRLRCEGVRVSDSGLIENWPAVFWSPDQAAVPAAAQISDRAQAAPGAPPGRPVDPPAACGPGGGTSRPAQRRRR